MARARNLKPGFFKNEDLADIGPHAQLLFAGLWTLADRKGRLDDRPRRIRAELFPFYEVDVDAVLSALSANGFIQRYENNGNKYIQINNFEKHQNPHVKEAESTIPAPGKHRASTGNTGTSRADSLNPLTDSLNPIVGAERSAKTADAQPAFITFPLNTGIEHPIHEDQIAEWGTLFPSVDIRQELRSMRAWLLANPTKRKTRKGVDRFATSWLSKEQDMGKQNHARPNNGSHRTVEDYRANLRGKSEQPNNIDSTGKRLD